MGEVRACICEDGVRSDVAGGHGGRRMELTPVLLQAKKPSCVFADYITSCGCSDSCADILLPWAQVKRSCSQQLSLLWLAAEADVIERTSRTQQARSLQWLLPTTMRARLICGGWEGTLALQRAWVLGRPVDWTTHKNIACVQKQVTCSRRSRHRGNGSSSSSSDSAANGVCHLPALRQLPRKFSPFFGMLNTLH